MEKKDTTEKILNTTIDNISTPAFNSLILITGKYSVVFSGGKFCKAKPLRKSAISERPPIFHPSGISPNSESIISPPLDL
jgi:hypothetical protein